MIRRIDDDTDRWTPPRCCRHHEHNPPGIIVLPPGLYEHECPSCGAKQSFRVPEPPMLSAPTTPYPSLDAVGITPDHKITSTAGTGKVSFPVRVYESHNDEMPWSNA